MIKTSQSWKIGDCVELMKEMPDKSIDTVITSPPYYNLRNYQVDGQIGMESSLEEYHKRLLEVTAEIYRVIKPSAVLFWNHGDSYDDKCLAMQNERLIIRMIDEQGFILRNRIIWNKPNGMPSSVTDRFSNKYEPVYMLTKQKSYWFDLDSVRVPHAESSIKRISQNNGNPVFNGNKQRGHPVGADTLDPNQFCHALGKNPGDVWTIPTQPYKESHFATFSVALITPLIKTGCPAEICPVCGFARERITEKFDFGVADSDTAYQNGNAKSLSQKRQAYRKAGFESPPAPKPVGWTSCDCGKSFIAGTVLDPFCGSGTVLEVCRKLNRNAIGLELNPDYEKLIAKRSMSYNPPLSEFW